ncbi:MAG: hypothetical protein V5A47_13565 [Bacteroidales bacterium]
MMMHSVKLLISDKVYDKFMWLLKKFSKDEVQIIAEEEKDYHQTKKYLENELKQMDSGQAKFYTLEEAEKKLEDFGFTKYQDRPTD